MNESPRNESVHSRDERAAGILQALRITHDRIFSATNVLLGFSAFVACIAALPDVYIVKTTDTLSVPLAGPASFLTLCILAPIFLVVIRTYIALLLRDARRLLRTLQHRVDVDLGPVSSANNRLLRGAFYVCHNVGAPLALGALAYRALAVPRVGLPLACVAVGLLLGGLWATHLRNWNRGVAAIVGVTVAVAVTLAITPPSTPPRPMDLHGANLQRENLAYRNLISAEMTAADLTEASLEGANLERANLFLAKLIGAQFMNTKARDNSGAGILRQAFLGGANMCSAYLSGADLSKAQAPAAIFRGADLTLANLVEADVSAADFRSTALWGTDFGRATIGQAKFDKAEFRCVGIKGCMRRLKREVTEAEYSQACCASLENAQDVGTASFAGACADPKARVPESLKLPLCSKDQVIPPEDICVAGWKG